MIGLVLSTLLAFSEPDPSWVESVQVRVLQEKLVEMERQIEVLEDKLSTVNEIPLCSNDADDLTFMHYEAVTDPTSPQYHFRVNGYTSRQGLRMYENYVQIAVGNYYGKVGDKLKVTFNNGKEILGIVGDSKGNRCYHQEGTVRSQVEMLVDDAVIPTKVWNEGVFNSFFGDKIVKIERID